MMSCHSADDMPSPSTPGSAETGLRMESPAALTTMSRCPRSWMAWLARKSMSSPLVASTVSANPWRPISRMRCATPSA